MTKSVKPNHELWKIFAHIAEGLGNMTFFIRGEDEEGNPGLYHTGVALEDMQVTITPHEYLPMTRIRFDLNLPADLTDYLQSDEAKNDYNAVQLTNYLTTRGDIEYVIYNEMMGSILEELKGCRQALLAQTQEARNGATQMVNYLGNLEMNTMDPKVAKKANRYYPLVINRTPNVLVHTPSDEWIDEHFGDMTSGDITRAESIVTRNAKLIGKRLENIAHLINDWGKTTEIPKDHDLWFSLNIEDHKISLGLDRQPYRSAESFMIERSPVDYDEWDDAADIAIIDLVNSEIDEMNIIVANLLNHNTGYVSLNKDIEQMYIRAIHHPIAKHTVRVWEFDDVCPAGRKLIDEEISEIMQLVDGKAKELEADVKLDISNMYLHQAAEGQNFILTKDHQVVADRCQTYSGSFFDSLQQHLFDVETPLFGPYTHVTPADLANEKFISEEDLLNPPTVH
ncbi:hypothetical protein [Vibrio phage VP4B]|uniref:Uncharacterized protein n=1 Tax=Vibrio phage VP4B TaxID=1262540 RepID=V9M031_9CAUD|nr:hypothetical protein FDJ61_gp196 [Vibrio phage VP4B]AGB07310.1 hypothetical protein [Vibrio phage VP4B]